MKKVLLIILALIFGIGLIYAQEGEEKKEKDKRPVRYVYNSGMLIDNQTLLIPTKNTLEFVIEHRFGVVNNGMEDFFGLWAPSNIRLGLNFSILDNLMIGIGTTKNYRLQDIRWKWNIVEQTRGGAIPVAVTYYGNFAIDARNKDNFGQNYKVANRFSYFTEIIVTRKFTDWFTMQVGGNFSHVNAVDPALEHDKIGVHVGGRFQISPQSSIIFQYNIPINTESIAEHVPLNIKPKPNAGLAWEISTSTHTFQLLFGTADYLIPQYNYLFNENEWTNGQFMFGINITRLWSF